jgi:hypothetical protein
VIIIQKVNTKWSVGQHRPPFIYSISLKTIPIHIFPLKILTQSYISWQYCDLFIYNCYLCQVRGWILTINLPLIDIMPCSIIYPLIWQIDENPIPLIYLTGQKDDPFQRYVYVYQDIGRGPHGAFSNKQSHD